MKRNTSPPLSLLALLLLVAAVHSEPLLSAVRGDSLVKKQYQADTKTHGVLTVRGGTIKSFNHSRKVVVPSEKSVLTQKILPNTKPDKSDSTTKKCPAGWYSSATLGGKCQSCSPRGGNCKDPNCCCKGLKWDNGKCSAQPLCVVGHERHCNECFKSEHCSSGCCFGSSDDKSYCRSLQTCKHAERGKATMRTNIVIPVGGSKPSKAPQTRWRPTAKPKWTFCPGEYDSTDAYLVVGHCCSFTGDCRNQPGKKCCSFVHQRDCTGVCVACNETVVPKKVWCRAPTPPPDANCVVDRDCNNNRCCSSRNKCKKCDKISYQLQYQRKDVIDFITKDHCLTIGSFDECTLPSGRKLVCGVVNNKKQCVFPSCPKHVTKKDFECSASQECKPGHCSRIITEVTNSARRTREPMCLPCYDKRALPPSEGRIAVADPRSVVDEAPTVPNDGGKCIVGKHCPAHACCTSRNDKGNVCRKCKDSNVELERCRRDSDCGDSQCCVDFPLGQFCAACPKPLRGPCETNRDCPANACCAQQRNSPGKICLAKPSLGKRCFVKSSELSQYFCPCAETLSCVAPAKQEVGTCQVKKASGKIKKRSRDKQRAKVELMRVEVTEEPQKKKERKEKTRKPKDRDTKKEKNRKRKSDQKKDGKD